MAGTKERTPERKTEPEPAKRGDSDKVSDSGGPGEGDSSATKEAPDRSHVRRIEKR